MGLLELGVYTEVQNKVKRVIMLIIKGWFTHTRVLVQRQFAKRATEKHEINNKDTVVRDNDAKSRNKNTAIDSCHVQTRHRKASELLTHIILSRQQHATL